MLDRSNVGTFIKYTHKNKKQSQNAKSPTKQEKGYKRKTVYLHTLTNKCKYIPKDNHSKSTKHTFYINKKC
jgi:hypothetical protein